MPDVDMLPTNYMLQCSHSTGHRANCMTHLLPACPAQRYVCHVNYQLKHIPRSHTCLCFRARRRESWRMAWQKLRLKQLAASGY